MKSIYYAPNDKWSKAGDSEVEEKARALITKQSIHTANMSVIDYVRYLIVTEEITETVQVRVFEHRTGGYEVIGYFNEYAVFIGDYSKFNYDDIHTKIVLAKLEKLKKDKNEGKNY